MRSPRFHLLLAALGSTLTFAAAGQAQTLPSIDARTFRPSSDPSAGLVLEPALTPGGGNWSIGGWLSYANHPVTLRAAATDDVAYRPVEHLVAADLTAAIGIGSRASVGLDVPVILYQDGSNSLPPTIVTSGAAPSSGLGDIAVHGKATILSNDGGGFGLAALAALTLPTGDRTSFMGDGSATVGARVLAEYSLVFAALQASVGYTLHTDHHTWPDPSVGGIEFGDQIPWTLGIRLNPNFFKIDSSNRQSWELALHGALPAGGDSNAPLPFGGGGPGSAAESPVLLAASDRIALGHYRDTFALAGVDVGLNTAVGVPTIRGIVGVGWAPHEHDMDHDGVPDDLDQCPEIPEDRDGFEDSDGCPDVDNDGDGIIDTEDACPNTPGEPSPDPKKNGCPGNAPQPKPASDRDGDGIYDDVDRCPDQPEDKDGFQDDDGCPDPDNDGDGISDSADACPSVPGEPSTDPRRNGCPNPDRDGDTYDNETDACPDAAEVFNGVRDDDGCPDEGGKPLVTVDTKDPRLPVRLAAPLRFKGTPEAPEVDAISMTTLRALGLELNRHRDWTVEVGARPDKNGEAAAMARATAVAKALGTLTHRDEVAKATGWSSVMKQPGSEGGLGFLVLVQPPQAPSPPPPK